MPRSPLAHAGRAPLAGLYLRAAASSRARASSTASFACGSRLCHISVILASWAP